MQKEVMRNMKGKRTKLCPFLLVLLLCPTQSFLSISHHRATTGLLSPLRSRNYAPWVDDEYDKARSDNVQQTPQFTIVEEIDSRLQKLQLQQQLQKLQQELSFWRQQQPTNASDTLLPAIETTSMLLTDIGKTMLSASFVFGLCGFWEVAEGFVAAYRAQQHAVGEGWAGVAGVLISRSLHGVMDGLLTSYLLFSAGRTLLQLGDDSQKRKDDDEVMVLTRGFKKIRRLIRKLRGATCVLLLKRLVERYFVHLGLKGIGPQALTPMFAHLVGHHHEHIEALEKVLGTGTTIEGSMMQYVERFPMPLRPLRWGFRGVKWLFA